MTEQADDPIQEVSLGVAWIGLEQVPAQFANVFMVQVNGEDIILSAGLGMPPPFPQGMSNEERRNILESLGNVLANPVVKIALNRARLHDLKRAVDEAVGLLEAQDAARNKRS